MNDDSNYGMPVHPICDLFPLIGGNDFQTLGDDIRANGLLHPIVIHEGQIVDGRNRLLACKDVDVEPRYVKWTDIYKGPMSLAKWIWSVNVERRHLTLDQITAVQVGIRAWEEKQAGQQRQVEAGKHGKEGGRGNKKPSASIDAKGFPPPAAQRKKPRTRTAAKLAAEVGVSERKVQQALNVQHAAPELLKEVAQGNATLREAEKQAKARKAQGVRRRTPKPRPFNLERELRKPMRVVDAVLDKCNDRQRTLFLTELIKTLEAMK